MKDSFGTLFIGALIGAAAAVLYFNKEKEVVQKGRRVVAQSKQALRKVSDRTQVTLEQGGEME